jgi:tetratricopeptide (TPR) repeat protein
VQFVSLQVGQAAREADQPPTGFTLFDASPHLSDLADTADLLAQLDLVITVDTAVAHLAGAMGKPVWLLIPRVPDFRWLLDRTDSPWYPSMVLFRQSIAGQWADPISTVVRALAAVVAGTRSSELHKLLATGQLTRPPVAAPTGPTTPTAIADADALCRQADQLFRARRISQAIDLYERALHVHPNRIDALTSLGAALNAVGRAADALLILDQALMAAPHNPGLLNSRGAALAALGQHDDAINSYQSALNERPEYSLARANLAHALAGREDYTAAIEQFHRVIAEDPNLAAAHLNLARCHLNRLEPDLALPALMNASRLMPGDVQTLHLLGAARSLIGQFDPADDAFRQAIALQPNFPEAHLGLAITLLVRGKFEQGWAEYEWRRKPANKTPIRRDLTQPDWDGSPLDGRTILIHAEQGMGDTLQFCRYIPDVVAKGGNVILECPPSQHRLLAASNLGARVESGGLPGHPVRYYPGVDLQLPLLSLPRVLGHTTFGQGGKPVPYLQPDPNLIELWRTRLIDSSPDNTKPFRIGLVWAGSPDHPRDNIRSTNLAAFQPLARDGVQFVSLQLGSPARQIAAAPSSMNILDITPDISDFADTAGKTNPTTGPLPSPPSHKRSTGF